MDLQIAALVVLVVLSAFFSGSETALMSLSSLKVRHLVREKKRGAETLYKLKRRPHRLLVTLLIGNNIVNIAASALATVVATRLFGSLGLGIAIGVVTFLILVFGEITPKSLALRYMVPVSLRVAPIIYTLSIILYPLVVLFELMTKAIMRVFGRKTTRDLTVEELKTIVIVGQEEGIIDRKLAKMMKNVLEFRDVKAEDIMTPMQRVRTVRAGSKLKQVIHFINHTPYSRYPVRSGSKIIGILDVDDVLKAVSDKKFNIEVDSIMQPAKLASFDAPVDDLFVAFDKKRLQMIIITDKDSKVAGIVTLEDVLEEIVGEIFDKSRHKMHVELASGEVSLDAGTSIRALNRALDLQIRSKYFSTIAGLLEHKLGRKPKRGDAVLLGKVRLKVTSADKHGANKVRIVKK